MLIEGGGGGSHQVIPNLYACRMGQASVDDVADHGQGVGQVEGEPHRRNFLVSAGGVADGMG